MFFLMRVAFWLCVVFALLPTGGSNQSKETSQASNQFNVGEAFSAATATMSDMRHFCDRQPEACAVGSQAASKFGQRAQAGAKMVYEFVNERLASQETGSVGARSASAKGSTSGSAAGSAAVAKSQNTLTSKDLLVPWRTPQAPREANTGKKAV